MSYALVKEIYSHKNDGKGQKRDLDFYKSRGVDVPHSLTPEIYTTMVQTMEKRHNMSE